MGIEQTPRPHNLRNVQSKDFDADSAETIMFGDCADCGDRVYYQYGTGWPEDCEPTEKEGE